MYRRWRREAPARQMIHQTEKKRQVVARDPLFVQCQNVGRAVGLEQIARAYARIIDQLDPLDRSQIVPAVGR